MEIVVIKGKEVRKYLDDIAYLRVTIFREWPYLYDGDLDSEKKYMVGYATSDEGIYAIAKDNGKVVGAVTGLPVCDYLDEIKAPFLKEGITMDGVFYLGEMLLLKEYRGKSLGKQMHQEFERLVKEKYQKIILCEIHRMKNDPRKPPSYYTLDSFWDQLGYRKLPNWEVHFSYKEIESAKETPHPMHFREKSLS